MSDRLRAWERTVQRLLDRSYPELAAERETLPDPLAGVERQRFCADRKWASETAEELRLWSERLAAAESCLAEREEQLDARSRELDAGEARLRDRERVTALLSFGLLTALVAVLLAGCPR